MSNNGILDRLNYRTAMLDAEDELVRLGQADPFVVDDVVSAEVIDIGPNLTDPRLAFLSA